MTYKVQSFGISDIGLTRQNNEDLWTEIPKKCFYALADGMGGHNAGEVAAKLTIEDLCASVNAFPLLKISTEEVLSSLKKAILRANLKVYQLAGANPSLNGMGTTLCCFLLHEKNLIYAHVGDSRIYRYRNGLKRMTKDHSLREELYTKGEIKEGQIASYPHKNVITKAIGTTAYVQPDIEVTEVAPQDIYFLCSDGLTDRVSDSEIAHTIREADSLENASHALVSLAKSKGGHDNITILMIKIL